MSSDLATVEIKKTPSLTGRDLWNQTHDHYKNQDVAGLNMIYMEVFKYLGAGPDREAGTGMLHHYLQH